MEETDTNRMSKHNETKLVPKDMKRKGTKQPKPNPKVIETTKTNNKSDDIHVSDDIFQSMQVSLNTKRTSGIKKESWTKRGQKKMLKMKNKVKLENVPENQPEQTNIESDPDILSASMSLRPRKNKTKKTKQIKRLVKKSSKKLKIKPWKFNPRKLDSLLKDTESEEDLDKMLSNMHNMAVKLEHTTKQTSFTKTTAKNINKEETVREQIEKLMEDEDTSEEDEELDEIREITSIKKDIDVEFLQETNPILETIDSLEDILGFPLDDDEDVSSKIMRL